jgi:hypothetical protein
VLVGEGVVNSISGARVAFLEYLAEVPEIESAWIEYQAREIPRAMWLMFLNDDPEAASLYDRWQATSRRVLAKGAARKAAEAVA